MINDSTKSIIRKRREKECFAYCDRAAWFSTLSESQKAEVLRWRKLWLDATETGVCPGRPSWIK